MLETAQTLGIRGELKKPNEEELQFLSDFIGKEAIDFIRNNNLSLSLTEAASNRYGKLRTYYVEVLGRIIEITHKQINYMGREEIEVHFAMTPSLLSLNPDRYQERPNDDQNNLAFLIFLKKFISSFNKEVPLRIKTLDMKKKHLFIGAIKKIGLTNVIFE